MTPEQRALETQILYANIVDYWFEVDMHGGAGVSRMYTADGVFHAGPGKPLVGRDAIEQFYGWRTDRGPRTSRHVVTNFRAEFADDAHATSWCMMLLHAADGTPVHPSAPPIAICDLVDSHVKEDDGVWRVSERKFVLLFAGGEAPTVPPETIAEQHNIKA
jgi:uncharacterized protein (TIGR02246 family)